MDTIKNKNLALSNTVNKYAQLWWSVALKRVFDIFVSALGMMLLLPFFLIVALIIKHEEPGPIFFRGSRAGKNGKEFGILKFRTMYEDPKSYSGPRVTAKDDDRITPLGRWLRDTKLNELPQLWNVFVGEMSLVGPRPEDPEIVKTWPPNERDAILSIRPGVTSPASILYRKEEDLLSTNGVDGVMGVYFREIMPDKLRLDRMYVNSHSFMGDLDIIFWTVIALVPIAARQKIPEGSLFVGPFYRFTRHYFSWFILDFLNCILVVGAVGLIWRIFEPINWGFLPLTLLAFAIAILFSSMNILFRLDRVYWSRAGAEDGFVLTISNGVSFAIIFLINSMSSHILKFLSVRSLPPNMILLISSLTLLGSLLLRYRLRFITFIANRWLNWRAEKTGFGERVLILGAGEGGEIMHWLLQRSAFKQVFTVIGMVDDDPAKRGMRINRSWVLGSSSELPDLIKKYEVRVVMFAITNILQEDRDRIIRLCNQAGVRIVYLSDLLGAIQDQLTISPEPIK